MCIVQFKKNYKLLTYDLLLTGKYFRNTILTDNVLAFLRDEDNMLDVQEVCFLHNKVPCFKALLLPQSCIDFFNNSEWPSSSPDLNLAEYLGAIIKDRVKDHMLNEEGRGRYSHQTIFNMTVNYSLNATVIPAQAGCCCCCCWRPHGLLICKFFLIS